MGHLKISAPLLVGHAEIDKEHQELAALVNRGMKSVADGALETCAGTLEELVAKLEQHFQNEERIMSELGYSDIQDHARQHRDCMTKVIKLHKQCRNSDCRGEDCVLDILSLVLEDLVSEDINFKSHLQAIGYEM